MLPEGFLFYFYILLTTAGVKCLCGGCKKSPVLHHCVVIFFWNSGIMECTCMLFTFKNWVPLMRSVVASFITTDEHLQYIRGCCFLVQAMLPVGFPFHQFNILKLHVCYIKYAIKIEHHVHNSFILGKPFECWKNRANVLLPSSKWHKDIFISNLSIFQLKRCIF